MQIEQERGLMPNVIAAQPNIGVLVLIQLNVTAV